MKSNKSVTLFSFVASAILLFSFGLAEEINRDKDFSKSIKIEIAGEENFRFPDKWGVEKYENDNFISPRSHANVGLETETGNQMFSDDFEDGDISDWTTVQSGSGNVVAQQYPGPDWSLNIYSPQGTESRAQATSPSFTLDESADYNVSMEFGFESPIHWIEVFRNQHINAVIDNYVGDNNWSFKCRYGGSNYLVMTMSPYALYNIEFRVHPASNNYDIYVAGIFRRTCDCDPGGPAFPQFRVGDSETGSSNYGTGIYDDFIVTQYICGDVNDDSGVDFTDILYLIDYIFRGGDLPQCSPIAICGDVNNTGDVDYTDILYLIDYIFSGGDPPVGYPGACGS